MIEAPLFSWLLLIFLISIWSFTSIRLAWFLPWSQEAASSRIYYVFGLALAPFLLGAAIIISIGLFPKPQQLYAIFSASILSAACVFIFPRNKKLISHKNPKKKFSLDEKIAVCLLATFSIFLIINSLFFPLTQNDSLEYATVGRILYQSGSLADYPVLNPGQNSAGFYAPWTHPPLYVAMIYASYMLQENADSIGIMRLISPWFALLAVALTCSVGSLINRRTGLYAAIFLFSTPIFFLGADSALIDPLPILGLLIVFTTTIALKTTPAKAGIIQGVVCGLALWTHSQAILFLPLGISIIFLANGYKRWPSFIKQCAIFLMAAITVAAYPYIRNLMIYGYLVSDSNPIYSLAELHWAEYFKQARMLNSTASIIQYGVLKGWFALEYYGFIFWVMSMAVICFFYKFLPFASLKNILSGTAENHAQYYLLAALTIIITYLCGTILSVQIGTDVMIRNERYLLIIFPYVALFSGWFAAICIESNGISKLANHIRVIWVGFLLFSLIMQFISIAKYRFVTNNIDPVELFMPQQEKLLSFPEMQAMNFLRLNTPENSLVLSTQPANMLYSGRKMVSYLDPRLVAFYLANNPENALALLKKMGITHVHLADYSLPVFYNSQLMNILADPKLSTLLYSSNGSQIYSLANSGLVDKKTTDISPGISPWIRYRQYKMLGKKGGTEAIENAKEVGSQEILESTSPFSLFQRNFSTVLLSAILINNNKTAPAITVNGGSEYIINFTLSGQGTLDFSIMQFDKNGDAIRDNNFNSAYKISLGNLVLSDSTKQVSFIRRIKLLPETSAIQLGIEQNGISEILIKKIQIIELKRNP